MAFNDPQGTRITIGAVTFLEKSVTPPGADGGDPLDITDMSTTGNKRKAPRTLTEITPGSATVVYNPANIAAILAAVNTSASVHIDYPDGSKETFTGWLRSFTPSELTVDGEQPTADIVVEAAGSDDPTYAAGS
jgi:hypothetical protein